jgi:hypothetical protein
LVGRIRLLLGLTRLLLIFTNISLFPLLFIFTINTSLRILGLIVRIDGKQVVHQLLLDRLAQILLNEHMQLSAEGVAPRIALLINLLKRYLAQVLDQFKSWNIARDIQYFLQVSVSCVHEQHH